MPTVKELRAQLAAAEQAEALIGAEELAKIPYTYDWSVTWKDEFTFDCRRSVSDDTCTAFKGWQALYPNSRAAQTWKWQTRELEGWAGSMYVLVETKSLGWRLFNVSGGTMILKATPDGVDTFSHQPRLVTANEAAMLRQCIVPDTLKM